MTDHTRVPDPISVAESLPKGAGVILRDYDLAERQELATDLSATCNKKGVLLLIGADAKLARSVGASGIHLPEYMIHQAPRLRQIYPGFLFTGAAHSVPAIIKANRAGLDAALMSPVFATESHPGSLFLGVHKAASMVQHADIPVLALGGIDAGNISRLNGAGFAGLVAIGALADQKG